MSPRGTIHELFHAQAARTPDACAVSDGLRAPTFAEFAGESLRLAAALRDRGVDVDRGVGVLLEKSADNVLACLAALDAGGAFLPLDLAQPDGLLLDIVRASGIPVVVTRRSLRHRLPADPGCAVLLIDEDPWRDRAPLAGPTPVSPEALCFLPYTSGTTGKPKGVEMPHRAAVHSYRERWGFQDYAPGDRVACNIFFVWEIFRPLLRGGTVFPVPDDVIYDPDRVSGFLAAHAITEVLFTPSLLETILTTLPPEGVIERLATLKTLWLNGEVVTARLRRLALDRLPTTLRLLNTYSISECHDVASTDLRTMPEPPGSACPVGRPIRGVDTYFLDEELNPVPHGEIGELFVGGPVVARGYLGQPVLTATRFPTVDGRTVYRTGDHARLLPDGTLEVLGRCDSMVKIRGYSVHLGAVEAALQAIDGVDSAAVVLQGAEGEDKRLVAYVVPGEGGAAYAPCPRTGTCPPLREALRPLLAEYSIPGCFVALDGLPLSPTTGKLQRKALPPPPERGNVRRAAVELGADAGPAEYRDALRELFAQVLGVAPDVVADAASFFDLGGHSLLAVDLTARIEETFARHLEVREVYEHATLADLADFLAGGARPVPGPDLAEAMRADAVLDAALVPPEPAAPTSLRDASRVLLTGATGFLGASLLEEVLRATADAVTVVCPVRAADPEAATARVRAALETNELWDEAFGPRIEALPCDLGEGGLGLAPQVLDDLAATVDVIFHCAALVNFVLPYSALRPATVGGTTEILRLAMRGKTKTLHHVSTNGVFPEAEAGPFPESRDIDPYAGRLETGYSQAKWVAEKLVWEAAGRGLPVCIYRPGNLGHNSRTGVANPRDLQYQLLEACLELGSAPSMQTGLVELTPVDLLTRAMVRFAAEPAAHVGRVYNVVHSAPLPLIRVVAALKGGRHVRRREPLDRWLARLEEVARTHEDARFGVLTRTFADLQRVLTSPAVFETAAFEGALDAAGIARAAPDRAYLESFLSRRGRPRLG